MTPEVYCWQLMTVRSTKLKIVCAFANTRQRIPPLVLKKVGLWTLILLRQLRIEESKVGFMTVSLLIQNVDLRGHARSQLVFLMSHLLVLRRS